MASPQFKKPDSFVSHWACFFCSVPVTPSGLFQFVIVIILLFLFVGLDMFEIEYTIEYDTKYFDFGLFWYWWIVYSEEWFNFDLLVPGYEYSGIGFLSRYLKFFLILGSPTNYLGDELSCHVLFQSVDEM